MPKFKITWNEITKKSLKIFAVDEEQAEEIFHAGDYKLEDEEALDCDVEDLEVEEMD